MSKTIAMFVVIITMSVMPFLWLPNGYMINSEDQLFMNYEILLDKASHAWTNFTAYGGPATAANHSLIIPNAYFYKALKSAGFSMDATQKLFMAANIFALLVAFWLFATLFTKKKHIIFIALISYYFNFYLSVSFTYTGKMFQLILTPLLFYITYKYLETGKRFYLAIHFVILFIFQAIFTNLTQLIALLPIYIIAGLFYCLQNDKKIVSAIRPLVLFILVTMPIYLYHALVYYFSLFVNLGNIRETATFSALFTDISRMFQFRGIWWEDAKTLTGIPYFRWSFFYNNPFIIVISFILLVIIFYLVLIRNKINRASLFFIVLYLLYFAASTGISFFPSMYRWLYQNFPFFYILREPWPKFMPGVLFAFSSLIVIALDNIQMRRLHYRILYFFLLAMLLVKGYPFFSSGFYLKWKNDLANIPRYWQDYRDWTLTQKDMRIFPVPFFKNRAEFKYNWYANTIGNSDSEMPFVFSAFSVIRYYENDVFSSIALSSLANKNFEFLKLGKTDYVLLQNDLTLLNNEDYYEWQKKAVLQYVEQKPIARFGNKLFVHAIKPSYHIPVLYIPTTIKRIIQSNDLTKTHIISMVNADTVMFPIHENGAKIQYLNDVTLQQAPVKPLLEYQKINPTKYKVTIRQVQGTFPLVLGESFNEEWKLYIGNSTVPVNESHHLVANGFLNSWIINPGTSTELELTIEYWPQRLFAIIYNVNLSIFFVFSIYSLYVLFTKLKQP